jgi:hypothetical protein
MASKRSYRWLFMGVVTAVMTTVAWFVINNSYRVNGVGLLESLGWPLSSVYLCAGAGAALGAGGEALRARRERRHARQLAEFADSIGFSFAPEVSADDLGEWRSLPVFQKWSGACNRLSGKVAGVAVAMLDYTHVARGDDGDSTSHQTLVLLPAGDRELPVFELQPRTLAVKILSAMGVAEVVFAPQDVPGEAAKAVEDFRKRYHLSSGLEAELARSSHRQLDAEPVAAIRELFTLEVLTFFADHPGWHVQAAGRCMVLWRPNKIVAAADRPTFLAEALAARAVLVESASATAGQLPVVARTAHDPVEAAARLAGAGLGAAIGFFGVGSLGGMLAMWIFFHGRAPGAAGFAMASALQAAVVFGSAFGGLFLGLFVGRRYLAGLAVAVIRRREERLRALHPNRPDDQPLASTAVLEEGRHERTITMPPAGLLRGCGCFVFVWTVLWNSFVALATPLFLVMAFQGKVQAQGGQGNVPPGLIVLFLTPFWLIGLGSALAIVYRGRRHARLTSSGDSLTFEEFTPFGSTRYEWGREKVADVRVTGPAAGQPQLVIASPGQPDREILGYRDRAELTWIAAVVREQLGIGRLGRTRKIQ